MTKKAHPASIQEAYQIIRRIFEAAELPTPDMDASLLLEHATAATALSRLTDPNRLIDDAQWQELHLYAERRLNHEPVHRIIGAREFYGLSLSLNEATLVPRPDTEILVDAVLPFVRDQVSKNGTCNILDLGTGTGAIALAILSQVAQTQAMGADISERALEMAQQNAKQNGLSDRFTAVTSNWFSNIQGSFDLIVSNPPYIASDIIEGLEPDVRDHDPRLALDGGHDGLNAYGIIAAKSLSFLKKGGRIAVEIGFDQKNSVSTLFQAAGLRNIDAFDDLNGQNRALLFH